MCIDGIGVLQKFCSFFLIPSTYDTIYLTNSITLDADPPTAGVGTWTVTSGRGVIEDEHLHNTPVTGLAKGERNEFQWTIINGVCETSDDWAVITQDVAQPYEGFSPDDDNINDYFIIRGLSNALTFEIMIFNALGQSVRRITHENVDEIDYDRELILGGLDHYDEKVVWDGLSNNGNPVPSGTYYYVLNGTILQEGSDTAEKIEPIKHYIIVR